MIFSKAAAGPQSAKREKPRRKWVNSNTRDQEERMDDLTEKENTYWIGRDRTGGFVSVEGALGI